MKSNNGRGSIDEVARLTEALRRESEQYIQVLADFDSYRRRVERERERTEQELAITRAQYQQLISSMRQAVKNLLLVIAETKNRPKPLEERLQVVCQQLMEIIQSAQFSDEQAQSAKSGRNS